MRYESRVATLGGKAVHLEILRRAGMPVPRFILLKAQGDIGKAIDLTKRKLKAPYIVRSSAPVEDNKQHSFAGMFESIVVDNLYELEEAILQVRLSAQKEYLAHYTNSTMVSIPVIIQEFIKADISGVSFTDTGLTEISQGGAQRTVAGDIDERTTIYSQSKLLGKKRLQTLRIMCERIHHLFGKAQDIEWAFVNKKLYILQSRPVTRVLGNKILWDNSNIAESYSGIVLPLTCSFAQRIYTQVYKDLARTSGVSQKRIRRYSAVFENLLGFHKGRFYYHMNNWHAMLALFPGFERNKTNLYRMLSMESQEHANHIHQKHVSRWFSITYPIHTFFRFLKFDRTAQQFAQHITTMLKISPPSNPVEHYHWLEWKLLSKWSTTVDNDFLAMTFYGFLRKRAEKIGVLQQELLERMSEHNSLISAQQVQALAQLAHKINQDDTLASLLKGKRYAQTYQKLREHPVLGKELQHYLSVYGGRFANELRLEAPNLDEDPKHFIKLLADYSSRKARPKQKSLAPRKDILFNYLLKQTRKYLRQREYFRLLRSQAFARVRDVVLNIAQELKEQGCIDHIEDVFYLTIDQMLTASYLPTPLQQEIQVRKKEYQDHLQTEVPNRFFTQKGRIIPITQDTSQATPCSPGRVTAKVHIMNSYKLPTDKNIGIIVTKHTDPGWTPLLGLCKGLIVERGGLLSHASIISRELGIPCIIGAEGISKQLKNGQTITMDGTTGEILEHR